MSDVTPLRILILDDQPELARVMRDVLRPQGFEVRAADTALTAMASARAAPPAVVLVRWDMPQGEASRFMELFRGASPGAVIVLTTGTVAEVHASENERIQDLLNRRPRTVEVDVDAYLRRLTEEDA